MLTDIKDFIHREIPSADVCIIGAGAAGMEITRLLRGTNLSITLLEGGYSTFDWRIQNLHRFQQVGRPIRAMEQQGAYDLSQAKKHLPHVRQFGGTLNLWGGRWKRFDPIDFAEKPYSNLPAWPVSYEELVPYYASLAHDYDLEELLFPARELENLLPLDVTKQSSFVPSLDCKHVPKIDLQEKFLHDVAQSSNIKIVLGANVTNIHLSPDFSHIDHVEVHSLEGYTWSIKAKIFILACGTISNARLLLCSNRQVKEGIGNQNDQVGRNLLDHPKGKIGTLVPLSSHKTLPEAFVYTLHQKRFRVGVSLSPDILRKEKLPNHYFRLFSLPDAPETYGFYFFLEQLPNLESRLYLSQNCDEMGVPLPCLEWKFQEKDFSCFKRYVDILKKLFAESQIGEAIFDDAVDDLEFLQDASHHMGTTRMGRSAQDGVVDNNCKVFGMDNLYIAGSSVFPSGGSANPTFTILALAKRLAEHIQTSNSRR